jgi:hypothetical protein
MRSHQRCSISQRATDASQTSAMTASAVTNVSASRRGADVGWRTSAAWPDGADKAPVPVAAILDHGGAILPRC